MFVSRMNEKKMLYSLNGEKAIQVKKYKKSSYRYELEMFDIKRFTKFFYTVLQKMEF